MSISRAKGLNKGYFKFILALSRNLPSRAILPQVFILLFNCHNSFKHFELGPCYWRCLCSKIAWLAYARQTAGSFLIALFMNHMCSLLFPKSEASYIIAGEENARTEQLLFESSRTYLYGGWVWYPKHQGQVLNTIKRGIVFKHLI